MNESKAQRILDLLESTNYTILQDNGQRIYGPPLDWPTEQKPPKNSEVFVGRLPRDCFEDELVPLFSQIGRIYKLRLMMDFSGTNRGFAFVSYTNASDAKKAVQLLNKFEIRRNHRIGVVESKDNCRLYIGNLPTGLTQQSVYEVMSEETSGVVSAILYYNSNKRSEDNGENFGFAFIEYESHRAAAMARRKLVGKDSLDISQLFDREGVVLDWAIPEPKCDHKVMPEVKVLFVRYLNNVASEEMIKSLFSFNNELKVIRVKRNKNYAFVHYNHRKEAELAMNLISEMDLRDCPLSEMGGPPLEVKWSIPPDAKSSKNKLMTELRNSDQTQNRNLNPMAASFYPLQDQHWNGVKNGGQLNIYNDFSDFSSEREKNIRSFH